MNRKTIYIWIFIPTAAIAAAVLSIRSDRSAGVTLRVITRRVTRPPQSQAAHEGPRYASSTPFNFVPSRNEIATLPSVARDGDKKSSLASGAKQSPICAGAPDPWECYEAHYQNLVKLDGVKAAVEDTKARYRDDAYVQAQCHPIMHVVGRAAVTATTKVSHAFTKGDPFCWSGYYHGVMEGIIGRIGRKNLPGLMDTICKDIPGKEDYSFDYYNCVHGLGHGVMAITQDELFQSLAFCDNLTGTWEQKSCWSGAFMENVIVDNLNHFTKYLKPEDPLYPCNAVKEKYKMTCYLMQTSYMLKVTHEDFTKVFALCEGAGDAYLDTCYQSLGRDASGHSVSNIEKTRASCMLGKDFRAQSNCVIGAVKDFISYFHSDTQARDLCIALPDDFHSLCLGNATNYFKSF